MPHPPPRIPRELRGAACGALLALVALTACALPPPFHEERPLAFETGEFVWQASPPLIGPAARPDDPCVAVKDPSVVRDGDLWRVFTTLRCRDRTHRIEVLSFRDWSEADAGERHVLALTDGYFCAPQVFWYRPWARWVLVYQVIDPTRSPSLQPAFSTSDDLSDPASWTPPVLLFQQPPAAVKRWIDFWVICDETRAFLFFTSLDGRLWRAETALADFPHGWSEPVVALSGDFFEAAHVYSLVGREGYLALIEARDGGRRYYKAWFAHRLDGAWLPLAATPEQPFASPLNAVPSGARWADSISHGELLRSGPDERLPVDPRALRFLFQGVSDRDRVGRPYGEIPWRLGLLTARP